MTSTSLTVILPSSTNNSRDSVSIAGRTRSLSELGITTSHRSITEKEFRSSAATETVPQRSQGQSSPPSASPTTEYVAKDLSINPAVFTRPAEPNELPNETLYTEPYPEQKRREQERHILGLFEQYSAVKSSGNRNYNYEEKYPEDQPGEELGPNARFFNVYLDEAEKYDDDMVRGLSGTLDTLLVFAALFSAVVTTFVVETSRALEPDQALITSTLLLEQVQLLRANGNATAIASISPSQYTAESPTHSISDVWINGLFFASLSLSLATALLSVLAKQWLQAYTSVTSGSARDTALIRHLRFMGFEQWRVPQIIGFLPLILHTSLGVFIAGLIVFLRALSPKLSWIVVGITGPAFFFYLVSILLPAIYIECPYRITVLYTPMKSVVFPVQLLYQRFLSWYIMQTYESWWRRLSPFLHLSRRVQTGFSLAIHFIWSHIPTPSFTVPVLKNAELDLVQHRWACLPVLCDEIVWLHEMSSNISVRRVAAYSLAGRDADDFSSPQMKKVMLSKLHLTSVRAVKGQWDPNQKSSLSHRAAAKLADRFHMFTLCPDDILSDWLQAARNGRTNELAYMHHVWKVFINASKDGSWTALKSSVNHGHYATTKLLLDLGADPNFNSPDNMGAGSALGILCGYGIGDDRFEIAKLLLDAGADVNLRGPSEYSWTPLYAASFYGSVKAVKWLIENGAELDIIGGPLGTALHVASIMDLEEVARDLLDNGAKVDQKNRKGYTPLQLALPSGTVHALLREHGATEL